MALTKNQMLKEYKSATKSAAKKFAIKKRISKKLQEGDFRINRKAKRVEMYNPSGKWVPVGRSMRTIKASKKAELAKKQAQLANMKTTVVGDTIKGLPTTAKKIKSGAKRRIKSFLSKPFKLNREKRKKMFKKATPMQIKIMKKFDKIK